MSETKGQWLLRIFWQEPPVIVTMAALFHVFLFIRALFDLSDSFAENWPTLAWYAVAAVLTVWCIFLKRFAAIAYILLTMTGLLLQFALPVGRFWKEVGSTLFPFDVLMCFFLLFYYKRFR